MIKVKMRELINSSSTLQKIGQQELRGIEAYKISKTLSIINKELNLYDLARNKLLQLYCIKNLQGKIQIDLHGQVTIEADKIENYNKEIDKLLQMLIELNIPLLEIDNLLNFILTPELVNKIDWWIEEKK